MAGKGTKKSAPDPLSLATSATMLWVESCYVIWARSWMIMAGGPGAAKESQRMVAEKVQASQELMMQAMTGSLGSGMVAAQRSVDHYGRKVSANRRRLAKTK
ncbi:hypothetical protein EKN06_04625 [Croceicoccus ponticola]|uniref:Antibiotic ABC transporter n=1 Tax=Croceicoccus ponticola TaxID=2217664 RepID=A0A437H1R6_9SPHN|nr:hypothetical protein [Croceicoccus ponticola]RVQ69462.1 hypothetical protein EKN06_04625 [Croceicoccus ponticola]